MGLRHPLTSQMMHRPHPHPPVPPPPEHAWPTHSTRQASLSTGTACAVDHRVRQQSLPAPLVWSVVPSPAAASHCALIRAPPPACTWNVPPMSACALPAAFANVCNQVRSRSRQHPVTAVVRDEYARSARFSPSAADTSDVRGCVCVIAHANGGSRGVFLCMGVCPSTVHRDCPLGHTAVLHVGASALHADMDLALQ